MNEEILRGALTHISKVCDQSTTKTRRIRWIKTRADFALAGKPFDFDEHNVPADGNALMAKYRNMAMALQTENERLSAELSACKESPGGCGYWREAAKLLEAECDPLKAEAEALLKDAERYRWLRDLPEGSVHEEIGNFPGDWWDEAIDSAMLKERQL